MVDLTQDSDEEGAGGEVDEAIDVDAEEDEGVGTTVASYTEGGQTGRAVRVKMEEELPGREGK